MSAKKRHLKVPGWGDPCPRCCQPTEIREHPEITEKHRRQPYYFTRWFYCTNPHCIVTLHMAERYKVWNGRAQTKAAAREDYEAAQRGKVIWGDSWDDVDQLQLL
jgi:hypothetical protein